MVNFNMAPHPKGVLFGPVKDWGQGSTKLLLESDGEGDLKVRRQLTLENVTNWLAVPKFQELGGEAALAMAMSSSTRRHAEYDSEGSFEMAVTCIERKGRGDEERFEVVDDNTAERAIELLHRGLAIQDEVANGSMEGLDVQYQITETAEEVLESIVVRPLKPSREPVDHLGCQINLSTPKRLMRKEPDTPAVQLARIEEALVEDEEMESDNETMKKKSAKKGKGKLTKGAVTLDMLNKKMDISEEATGPRKFDEVRANLFATHPPSWKLEDSQRGWRRESTQQSIKTAAEVVIPDSDNDMDSDDESIPDDSLTRDKLLHRYRKKPLLASFSGTKGNGPMATVDVVPAVPIVKMEVDRGEGKAPEGLNVSKHAVKELTIEEVKKIAKEMRTGNAGCEEDREENEEMRGEEEEEKEIAWNRPCDNRTLTDLVICIMLNGRVMSAISELEKGKKWWKSAQDYKTAKGQVLAAGWMIEAELYAGGLGEGKGWKKLKEEVRAGRSEVEAIDMAEAVMTFHEAAKVNTGDLSRIESQLEKLTKQVSMLACLNGAGSTEDQAQAKRQASQKKAEVEKNTEKAKQIKKIELDKKAQAEKTKRDQEEDKKARELAAQVESVWKGRREALESANHMVEELTAKAKQAVTPAEIVSVGEKLKEAMTMREKLEAEGKVIPENKVGEKRVVVGNKVLKVAKIILAHMQSIDGRGKAEVEDGVNKVNALLREKAITNNTIPWHTTVEIGKGSQDDESRWTVSKIGEDCTKQEVLTTVTEGLTAVFGAKGDMLNAWMEDEKTVRMLMPAAPSKVARGRRDIGRKLREENKDMKMGHRFSKIWGAARTTGVTFDVADHTEAKRLVEKGVMWEGVRRQVQMMDTNKMGEFKHSPPPQKKEEKKGKTGENKTSAQVNNNNNNNNNNKAQQRQQQTRQYFSNVIYYNCNGAGHKKESCSSASRAASARISGGQKRNSEVVGANENGQQTQKRKVEEVKTDKDVFEKVQKKKGWNVWKKPALKTAGGVTPGPSNARISEVLDDDVEDWTPDRFGPNAQKPPVKSDWSPDEQPGLGKHLF